MVATDMTMELLYPTKQSGTNDENSNIFKGEPLENNAFYAGTWYNAALDSFIRSSFT